MTVRSNRPAEPALPAAAEGLPQLGERQRMVLRALVAAYIAEAAPVGSRMLAHLLPVALSPASVRATLGELGELGLVDQPHASAGRVPTTAALRLFVHQLMEAVDLGDYERRALRHSFESVDSGSALALASSLLSEHVRQLGFASAPRLERLRIQHLSFVRIASGRILVVLVSRSGRVHRRLIHDRDGFDQAELDRIALLLNERVAGRTLVEVRRRLEAELRGLRERAGDLVARALGLGLCAVDLDADQPAAPDLVLGTRLALLDQPEFRDPERIRGLFAALEAGEHLMGLLERVMASDRVHVLMGDQLDATELRDCALVAAPYGRAGEEPLGAIGVIGPARMDYRRVIPVFDFCSELVSDKVGVVAADPGEATHPTRGKT